MNKAEKIKRLVNCWVAEMDLSALEDFYADTKTEELEDWSEEDLDECLKEYE